MEKGLIVHGRIVGPHMSLEIDTMTTCAPWIDALVRRYTEFHYHMGTMSEQCLTNRPMTSHKPLNKLHKKNTLGNKPCEDIFIGSA